MSTTTEEKARLLRAAGPTILAEGDTEPARTVHRPDGTRIILPARRFAPAPARAVARRQEARVVGDAWAPSRPG
ncbi:hypothetical protein [Streptomyces sp. NPDC056061]|uniref:hypothetical protein n=1 Tax=Streptomyces sp. NPDC056061 TaxID=3345700 RepID=UPI0035DAAE92